MCGICGYFDIVGQRQLDLKAMALSIAHRGPDDSGLYEVPGMGLGHRRLSILDLSSAGHQPMMSIDGGLTIVFNGEIYNYIELREELAGIGHQFRSHTDTEVILAAYAQWGADCIKRFNGMWSFVLWDRNKKTLFCSRDRFGVKPFYYLYKDGMFVFGSEPKAILAALPAERKPDWGTLHKYLTKGNVMNGDRSFYESIQLLLPAHNLFVSSDGIQSVRFWNYPDFNPDIAALPTAELAEKFRALFLDSVKLRARSDVEVGTTLSGGLDSSAIVAAFKNIYPDQPHRSYSAIFSSEDYDESEYIDAVVEAYGLDATKIEQTSDNLLSDLRKMVWHLDSPLISPAIIPLHRILKDARSKGTIVLYDGQGADEILAGYDNQFYPAYVHSILRGFSGGRTFLAVLDDFKYALAGMTRTRAKWMGRYLAPWAHGLYRKAVAADAVLTPEFRRKGQPEVQSSRRYDDPLNETLYRAHSDVILPSLLHYGDAVSMASSVEYRLPFMDYRLVEFAFSLPTQEKISKGYTKHILRSATEGMLIDKVRLRRSKNGFSTPMRRWILEQPDVMDVLLNGEGVRRHGVFSQEAIAQVLNQQSNTSGNQLEAYMLRWVTTELWLNECIDKKN
ncbi:asparagine synthase (glutamine-hydrolyzing) [Ferrovum myxofaciens]|uniref:asparagine synthase (glutamine-hydrolyzing) n=1 Tax=Ferrovum myxofaciens TaxID=416213 RepID=UPI003EB7719D